jgi:Na+/proline symporter
MNWFLLGILFFGSTSITTLAEMFIWKYESSVALILMAVTYFLGCWRILPWKSANQKAATSGVLIGLLLTLVFWKFRLSI